ncbi:MAG TPA: hypothetical protein VEG34_16050 [Thermoanaerobaculia bacterium]|nr:hypothetical protein [Thermoanaerobaculia bacterium]
MPRSREKRPLRGFAVLARFLRYGLIEPQSELTLKRLFRRILPGQDNPGNCGTRTKRSAGHFGSKTEQRERENLK